MANRTCDADREADAQAEPVDAQIPSMSRFSGVSTPERSTTAMRLFSSDSCLHDTQHLLRPQPQE